MPMSAGLPSVIKSIQRGTIVLSSVSSNTATVAAVTTSKAELNNLGAIIAAAGDSVRLTLTNSTTITADRTSSTGVAQVSYELIEFY